MPSATKHPSLVPPDRPETVATELPAARDSPYRARCFVTEHLRAWGCTRFEETATLLMSEVVTNGVTHAATPLGVAMACDGATVVVAVTDGVHGGIDIELAHRAPWRGATSGRGLHMVDLLADQWGVTEHDTGKTIWFVVSADPSSSPTPAAG